MVLVRDRSIGLDEPEKAADGQGASRIGRRLERGRGIDCWYDPGWRAHKAMGLVDHWSARLVQAMDARSVDREVSTGTPGTSRFKTEATGQERTQEKARPISIYQA